MLARERFTRAATLNFDKWTFVRSFGFGRGTFMADVLFGSGFVRSNFDSGFSVCVYFYVSCPPYDNVGKCRFMCAMVVLFLGFACVL